MKKTIGEGRRERIKWKKQKNEVVKVSEGRGDRKREKNGKRQWEEKGGERSVDRSKE